MSDYKMYKYHFPETEKAVAYLLFKDQLLRQLFVEPKDNNYEVLKKINLELPFNEEALRAWKGIVELKPRTVQDKIVAFCMAFRNYRKTAYTPKKNERANIADVSVSKEMLDAYFTSSDFPLTYAKSISDYVRHYNYLRDITANGKPSKSKYPDVYDREFERKLDGPALSAYWQHLHALGWKKIDGQWKSPESLH